MVFLKLLLDYPYTIRVETSANRLATPKSLVPTIEISVSCPTDVVVTPFYIIL